MILNILILIKNHYILNPWVWYEYCSAILKLSNIISPIKYNKKNLNLVNWKFKILLQFLISNNERSKATSCGDARKWLNIVLDLGKRFLIPPCTFFVRNVLRNSCHLPGGKHISVLVNKALNELAQFHYVKSEKCCLYPLKSL